MFLLDTNVLSELRRNKRNASIHVRHWASQIPFQQLYVSCITILELEVGTVGMERRDALQGAVLRRWLESTKLEFSPRILPFDVKTAKLCATLHVPHRRPERDAMIAATAGEHGFTVVTRNTRDFEACGVPVVDPWLRL